MPLMDHFHPPFSERRQWHAFHHAWATFLAADLNRQLPAGYFAEPNVEFGVEIDVATFEDDEGGTAALWVPPAPTQTVRFSLVTDVVEVQIFNREAGPVLAGAIELVSPANKDRTAHRDAFVSKCAAHAAKRRRLDGPGRGDHSRRQICMRSCCAAWPRPPPPAMRTSGPPPTGQPVKMIHKGKRRNGTGYLA